MSSQEKAVVRMPDTAERARLERRRGVREIVFGAQDGLLTTLGIVTGLGSAVLDRSSIVLTGILAAAVGALSMGVGEYLGGKAEREVVKNAIDRERREMAEKPEEEYAEQVGFYKLKGFTDLESRMIVDRLAKNPEIWLHEMVRDEFGIDPRMAQEQGAGPAFAMAGSFVLGASVPIIPYVTPLPLSEAIGLALLLAIGVLFGIGVYAGRLSGKNPIGKGLEIVAFGAGLFAVSYVLGHVIPPLFGKSAVNVGA